MAQSKNCVTMWRRLPICERNTARISSQAITNIIPASMHGAIALPVLACAFYAMNACQLHLVQPMKALTLLASMIGPAATFRVKAPIYQKHLQAVMPTKRLSFLHINRLL